MQKETWIGIAWAIGLFAAMGAVFAYEAATFELSEYPVDWQEVEKTTTETRLLAEAGSARLTQTIPMVNLTWVEVEIVWTDSDVPSDSFRLTLISPNGTTRTVNGNAGSLVATMPLATVPTQDSMKGVNHGHAKETDLPAIVGEGAMVWTAEVTLTAAPPNNNVQGDPVGGDCADVATAARPTCDGAQDFRIYWRWSNYHATFEGP